MLAPPDASLHQTHAVEPAAVGRAVGVEIVRRHQAGADSDDLWSKVGEVVGVTALRVAVGRLHQVGRAAVGRPREQQVVALLEN